MATVSAPFNAEPALPEDRAKQHLAPKSYADAVEEPPVEASNGVNGTNGINGTNKQVGDGDAKGGHKASVLKIVDTGVPPPEEKKEEKKGEKADERPQYERQESKQEYSATVCCLRSVLMLPIYLLTSTGTRWNS
jgi:2-acylglycerol O-acyltransferase 2